MKALALICLSFFSLIDRAEAFTGSVATANGQYVEVQLQPFAGGNFENDLIKISDVPGHIDPDKNGCFCYSPSDPNFAYVHAYFHASQQILAINKLLVSLGLSIPPRINILLKVISEQQPSGSASGGNITLRIAKPDFDVSLLAHEVGHEIHFAVTGKTPTELLEFNNISDTKKWTDAEWDSFAQRHGSLEGTANLLSAFYINDPIIGKLDWYEAAVDINAFVILLNPPTYRSAWQRRLESKIYSQKYPKSKQLAEEQLNNPIYPRLMNLPDPYLASSVINAPLWQAGQTMGRDVVLKIFLKSLSTFRPLSSYVDFANLLVRYSQENQQLQSFLESEYKKRGVYNLTSSHSPAANSHLR